MAVSPPSEDAPAEEPGHHSLAEAPNRDLPFVVEPHKSLFYRFARFVLITTFLGLWFRPKVTGLEHVPTDGPVILAPVHRSFADFAFAAWVNKRKLFFMAKDDLWKNRVLGRLLVTLGAFPVHREAADREALRRAEEVLKRGQVLVLFPEGTRKEGPLVAPLHEGAAFLSARTGAPIVPIGIGNSDRAMPKGRTIPKPLTIQVVVGEPIEAPARSAGGRVSRSQVHATTEELARRIQVVFDDARVRAGQ